MVTERELQDLLAKLDEERSTFLAALEGMSEAEAARRRPTARMAKRAGR